MSEREMTMVERVAKAIYTKNANRSNNPNILSWGQIPPSHKQFWCECAAAAIGAMREPTEAMIMSQGKSKPENAPNERIRESAERLNRSVRRTATVIYQEMIDAALKEHERKPE